MIRFKRSGGSLRTQRGSTELVHECWYYLEILNPVQESIFIFQKFILQAFTYSFVTR